ncbi:MAG: regulatory protein RecX [Acinetobacter sp.]|nr:regulatory protein RecX [Acinetobacter sp.]
MWQRKRPEDIEKTLTGTRLRSYAFALLTRREYSKHELSEKLKLYAIDPAEVDALVAEFAESNYQSDQRVAESMLASQVRKGKGLHRVKQALEAKGLNSDLIADDLKDVDWLQQAYQLKIKKFGTEIAKDPKIKAKQIRFLQYRGFTMDVILKAIKHQIDE